MGSKLCFFNSTKTWGGGEKWHLEVARVMHQMGHSVILVTNSKSQLHSRVMQQASKSMASRYFSVPPKEFMFISRKFIGAYTFMTVIDAKTNVRKMIQKFI